MMRDRMNRKKTWFLAVLLGMLLTVWAAGGFQETGEGIPVFPRFRKMLMARFPWKENSLSGGCVVCEMMLE